MDWGIAKINELTQYSEWTEGEEVELEKRHINYSTIQFKVECNKIASELLDFLHSLGLLFSVVSKVAYSPIFQITKTHSVISLWFNEILKKMKFFFVWIYFGPITTCSRSKWALENVLAAMFSSQCIQSIRTKYKSLSEFHIIDFLMYHPAAAHFHNIAQELCISIWINCTNVSITFAIVVKCLLLMS